MKLEEVLPAMREGRVALREESGKRYRIDSGVMEVYDTVRQGWRMTSLALVDGWTLEPEPKVEWPKGSMQWAESQPGAKRIMRRGDKDSYGTANGRWVEVSHADRHALDWEVVP